LVGVTVGVGVGVGVLVGVGVGVGDGNAVNALQFWQVKSLQSFWVVNIRPVTDEFIVCVGGRAYVLTWAANTSKQVLLNEPPAVL